jgi:putative heme iron utilization protein
MEKETLKKIIEFLEKEENKMPQDKGSFKWKVIFNELTHNELNINDNLELSYTKVTSLPEGLRVKGWLNLMGSAIASLPEGLVVGGYLSLASSNIESLPKGLKVGGHLNLRNSNIKNIPDDIEIGGSLYLQKTKITSLPKGLIIKGYLVIDSNDSLDKFSNAELKEMVKPGFIKGILRE